MQHDKFQDILDALVKGPESVVGQEVLGEVLARVSLRAPEETSRWAISAGNPTARRPRDQRPLPAGTVSRAVKALKAEGLLEEGSTYQQTPEGRPLASLRLGRGYAIAGVKVGQAKGQPRHVTTALLGLDSSRKLADPLDGEADSWDGVADLVHGHVVSLKKRGDQERGARGLPPLRIFGIGVEVGAPVYNGEVTPLSRARSQQSVPLANMLHRRFEADLNLGDAPVPVIVENDVNALAVLAIHQIDYSDPDLVVVGVFDEGIGGGLVMDGRLRRGDNGRAMEIGHLEVASPPGEDPESKGNSVPASGFGIRCLCGQLGHVDTLAPPRRIEEQLGGALEQLSEIKSPGAQFEDARKAFKRSGAALGRALAHVSNTVNPSQVIMYMPAALADPKPDTAGAAYLAEVEAEADRAFAASGQAGYLRVRAFSAEPEEVALLGARAAAVCVLESFIEHALRLDGCKPRPRSGASNGHASAK